MLTGIWVYPLACARPEKSHWQTSQGISVELRIGLVRRSAAASSLCRSVLRRFSNWVPRHTIFTTFDKRHTPHSRRECRFTWTYVA